MSIDQRSTAQGASQGEAHLGAIVGLNGKDFIADVLPDAAQNPVFLSYCPIVRHAYHSEAYCSLCNGEAHLGAVVGLHGEDLIADALANIALAAAADGHER